MSNDADPAQSRETTPDATEASETELATVSRAMLAYRPAANAGLTDDEWDAWGPLLVRRTLGMGQDVDYSRSVMSNATRFVAWALANEETVNTTDDIDDLLHHATIARYLGHLIRRGRSEGSTSGIKTHLTKLAAAPAVEPEDVPHDETDAAARAPRTLVAVTVADDTDPDGPVLVEDDRSIDRTTLGLAPDDTYWALLRLIRDRILAEHPDVHAKGRDGQHLPLGDVEVARLFAATAPMRRTMRRDARLYLCLGLGAGLTNRQMARVKGTDLRTDLRAGDGRTSVAVRDDTGQVVRTVPVLAPFAPMLGNLAHQVGDAPVMAGRGKDTARRAESIRVSFTRHDPYNVRPTPWRLRATWVAVHLAAGTPLPALMSAAGFSTTEPFASVLAYLPATGRDLSRPWSDTNLVLPDPVTRTPQADARTRTSPTGNLRESSA